MNEWMWKWSKESEKTIHLDYWEDVDGRHWYTEQKTHSYNAKNNNYIDNHEIIKKWEFMDLS